MNRDDLLKKCVDRGVADEASIEAVSHLFYMYMLTALQKGQRVEVPNFGTFGTRVVGVKRLRRMPFFEVEKDLAERVNERYRDLKYLVVGRYELSPAEKDIEYEGKEAPHDVSVDQVGREMVLDTHRDVTIEEYERTLALSTQAKEKQAMPKLNLKDTGIEEGPKEAVPEKPAPPHPPLRMPLRARRGPSPIVQIVIAVLLLCGITAALNYFGIIHLWGKKAPRVTQAIPETELPPPAPQQVPQPPAEVTPTPTPGPGPAVPQPKAVTPPVPKAVTPPVPKAVTPPAPKPVVPPKPAERIAPAPVIPPTTGAGEFTVQVSSWLTMSKANEEVSRLSSAGLSAFVSKATVAGETRYRVRVGRYATRKEAENAAAQLQTMLENGIWVDRERSK